MSVRFYIVDDFAGVISGTNSEELAMQLAEDERYYVIDTKEVVWLTHDGCAEEIVVR